MAHNSVRTFEVVTQAFVGGQVDIEWNIEIHLTQVRPRPARDGEGAAWLPGHLVRVQPGEYALAYVIGFKAISPPFFARMKLEIQHSAFLAAGNRIDMLNQLRHEASLCA